MTVPAPLTLAAVAEILRDAGLVEDERALPAWEGEGAVIRGVSHDTRTLAAGELFVAWRGGRWDGHLHLKEAESRGAAAAVVETRDPALALPQFVVSDPRRAAALLADAAASSPWKELLTYGVTGTNGKTTVTLIARHLLEGRYSAAAIGTLGLVEGGGRIRPGTEGLTTPGPVVLSTLLRGLVDQGVRAVGMEASSHALDQHRLDGVWFRVAAFTNLTRDHLDYHPSMEAYRRAKLHLVDRLLPGARVVVNASDPAWVGLDGGSRDRILFALEGAETPVGPPDLLAIGIQGDLRGSRFGLRWGEELAFIQLPLVGRFNIENALAAAGIALALGVPFSELPARLASVPPIPGRLERLPVPGRHVMIDFAHTPEALDHLLRTLRPLVSGRLLVLFGAGGDRDRGKRPLMGQIVERWADLPIVTSDNPRTEDPDRIIEDIRRGVEGGVTIVDRREAIRYGLRLAGPDDLLLLAGKGHERTQTIGTESLPFDEREIVASLLAEEP